MVQMMQILREHADSKGFTLESVEASPAFEMALKMASAGYSVKLHKDPGAPWIVSVREVVKCDSTESATMH